MRRSVILALLVLSLMAPLSASELGSASARPASADERSYTGLLITARAWGKLERGMTVRQAQRTGMVSRQLDQCSAGYQLTWPYRSRGYVVWSTKSEPWTVRWIIVTGRRDHTRAGSHPGTTLRALRRQNPHLSKVHSGSSMTGQTPSDQDVWVAWVHKAHGTIDFQFPYGTRPTGSTRVESVVVSGAPTVFYGC